MDSQILAFFADFAFLLPFSVDFVAVLCQGSPMYFVTYVFCHLCILSPMYFVWTICITYVFCLSCIVSGAYVGPHLGILPPMYFVKVTYQGYLCILPVRAHICIVSGAYVGPHLGILPPMYFVKAHLVVSSHICMSRLTYICQDACK